MDCIFRGQLISQQEFIVRLPECKESVQLDLLLKPLPYTIVIEALHTFAVQMKQEEIIEELVNMGIPRWTAHEYVRVTIKSLDRIELYKKLHAELGEDPFTWKKIGIDREEKQHPLGVMLHIGAGNTLGLSAFSVIEGLLTGNINILKLPEHEGGLSAQLLIRLLEIEPRLQPYIYVLDISSRNTDVIRQLIEMVDAVVVWGSDDTISAIRKLVPPTLRLIEWGHRLSFAYFTKHIALDVELYRLALDICLTDQLYCSSPQCVFLETENHQELDAFAEKLANQLAEVSRTYPASQKPIDIQAQITWMHELVRMEAILGEKRLFVDEEKKFGVMVDYHPQLKASPLFRNIWVMPVKRSQLHGLLREHIGHLQTVGLSCNPFEYEELTHILYAAGVNRITVCGSMSVNYSGEPHDGVPASTKYVRIINRQSQG